MFKCDGLLFGGKAGVMDEMPWPIAGGGRRIAGIMTQHSGLQIVGLTNISLLTEADAFNHVHIGNYDPTFVRNSDGVRSHRLPYSVGPATSFPALLLRSMEGEARQAPRRL